MDGIFQSVFIRSVFVRTFMNEKTSYQGSQAFNQSFLFNEYVTPNTGTLNLSKPLVQLRGITTGTGLTVNLSYTPGTEGLFGLPDNWGLNIAYLIPDKTLTTQGKTYLIDPSWTDESGYASGLRYVNDHGIRFEPCFPPQPLPFGQAGEYAYVLRYTDGARDFFDLTGKQVAHADLFGNAIHYVYTDPFSGPLENRLDCIIDSFKQTIRFRYDPNAILVLLPDGSQTTVHWSERGVETVQDALRQVTAFGYVTVAGQTVVSTIRYPSGLKTQLEYTTLPYNLPDGRTAAFPAVSRHCRLGATGSVLSLTEYIYGDDTGGASFTGISAGYTLSSDRDSLMESGNTFYQYDVLVQHLDKTGTPLSASRLYYNYLHLPVREEHYLVDPEGRLANGYRALYEYRIAPDYHARTAGYTLPVLTQQWVYDPTEKQYRPLRKACAEYDNYGQPLVIEEFLYDAEQHRFVSQTRTENTYVVTSWGGQMPSVEIHLDRITDEQKKIVHTLTADQKHVASSTVYFRENRTGPWQDWKKKSYFYDECGRVVHTELTWQAPVPEGSAASTLTTNTYCFDAVTRSFCQSETDALGHTTSTTYDVGIATGPVVRITTPSGHSTVFAYDALGRQTRQTDALGNVTTASFDVNPATGVTRAVATGPTGYVTIYEMDELGRIVRLLDNGDPTQVEKTDPDRVLRHVAYNELGKAVSETDENGLVTHFVYDSLGRLIETTDPLGNRQTTLYRDASGIVENSINGACQTVTRLDAFGRTRRVTRFPDSGDAETAWHINRDWIYNGAGLVISQTVSAVYPAEKREGLLEETAFRYNVEAAVVEEHFTGYGSEKTESVKTTAYDLFGNPIPGEKRVTYADGRTGCSTPIRPVYDKAGRLVCLTHSLNRAEHFEYNSEGALSRRSRLDGTVFDYEYDAIGRLSCMRWDGGRIEHTYYPNGRVKSTGDGRSVLYYSYYRDGAAESVVFPDGKKQTWKLDKTSRVVESTDACSRTTFNAFDTYGRPAERRVGPDTLVFQYGTVNHVFGKQTGDKLTGPAVSLDRTLQYDGFGQLCRVQVSDGDGKVLIAARLKRNPAGKMILLELASEHVSAASVNLRREASYDGLGQLRACCTTDRQGKVIGTEAFLYDGNANIIEHTRNGHTTRYDYNALDQIRQEGILYDPNGRMVADGTGRRYRYNALDQLSAVLEGDDLLVSYRYWPDGALADRTSGDRTDRFYRQTGAVNAVETQIGTAASRKYCSFWLDGQHRRAVYSTDEPPAYFLTGENDSTRLLFQEGKIRVFDYEAFGLPRTSSPLPAEKSFGWRGEYTDPDSGLVYLRSRHYHPALKTFMTMDSVVKDNRYAYCAGDPLNLADPSGHMEGTEIAGLAVGLLVGIVATAVTGGAAGAVAAAVFGPECVAAGVGATALAGAVGSVAGDATSCGIMGQKYTATRALVDLASGTAGGIAGAGVGGVAGRVAMASALSNGLSQRAITLIGTICSGATGGISGSLAASGVESLITEKPFFSADTALNLGINLLTGIGGGMLVSDAYLGLMSKECLPVPLKDADLHLIRPARNNTGHPLPNELLVMAPQDVADATALRFRQLHGAYEAALTLNYQHGAPTYDTIAAHGAGNTLLASVEYLGRQYGPLSGRPNYVRPVKGKTFTRYLITQGWHTLGTDIKLMSCFGAFSNAHTIAKALHRNVYAGYPEIDRYTFTRWKLFT